MRFYSRLNRRHRLETFMKESADLMFRHQILDWHRRIRALCPKQARQRIQIYDQEGAP